MSQSNSDRDAYGHGFANGDADTDGDAYSDGHVHAHTDPDGDAYTDANTYSDGHVHAHAYSDSDGYGDAYTDANGYGYVYADSYSDGYGYSYAHTDAYGYSDSNSYGNSDLNAYSNCGEAFADAETASNDTATASVVGSGKWNSSGRNSRETLASSPPEVDWLPLIFARSALGVRCVLASLLRRMKLSPQGACVI